MVQTLFAIYAGRRFPSLEMNLQRELAEARVARARDLSEVAGGEISHGVPKIVYTEALQLIPISGARGAIAEP
jgi:hypothetical protein